MPEVLIRPADMSQAAEIAVLYVRTRRLAYAPFFPQPVLAAMSVPAEVEKWRLRLAEGSAQGLVAADEAGTLCGFAHTNWQSEANPLTGEIEFMYVAPEYQGSGLGGRLMTEAEALFVSRGLKDAVLWVYEDNVAARGFYERCGWSADGGRRASDSALGLELIRYRRQLA